jgi:hypothetical protein
LRVEDPAGRAPLGLAPEGVDPGDARVAGEEVGDRLRVARGGVHAQRDGLERPAEHPARVRSSCVPIAPRSSRIGRSRSRPPTAAPATRSLCPPTYLVSE